MIIQTHYCSNVHHVKSVRIRSHSGPHFPLFRLNTERYFLSVRIQFECEKMRTIKTLNTDTFYAVVAKSVSPEISKSVNKALLKWFIMIRKKKLSNQWNLLKEKLCNLKQGLKIF